MTQIQNEVEFERFRSSTGSNCTLENINRVEESCSRVRTPRFLHSTICSCKTHRHLAQLSAAQYDPVILERKIRKKKQFAVFRGSLRGFRKLTLRPPKLKSVIEIGRRLPTGGQKTEKRLYIRQKIYSTKTLKILTGTTSTLQNLGVRARLQPS